MRNITDLGKIVHVDDEPAIPAAVRRILDIPREEYLAALTFNDFLEILERLSGTRKRVALLITDFSFEYGFDGFDAVSVVEALQKTAALPEHLKSLEERIARISSEILEKTKIVMISGNFEPPDLWTGGNATKMAKARERQQEVAQNSPALLTIVPKPFGRDELITAIRKLLKLQEPDLQEVGR